VTESEVTDSHSDAVSAYFKMRIWQDAKMPIYGSFIGLDLIMFLSKSRTAPSPYSLKDVFHSLTYSEGALRIFIRRLEKDGWLSLETWPGDRRNKKIIISPALETVIDEFLQYLRDI
jgi:DNA-binding MarR family transcriptional regulator